MVNDVAVDPVALANRLRPVVLQLNRHLRREAASLGVTGGQAALLHTIRQTPGIGVRELATRESVSAPAMSGYVDRLEAAGLVTRARSPDDRRRVGLVLTPQGVRALRSVRSRRTAWLASRLKGLSADELARLDAAVEPLQRVLRDVG